MCRLRSYLPCLLAMSSGGGASAQAVKATDGPPVMASIRPPAATVGKVTEWTVTGGNLARAESWTIAGGGASVVEAAPAEGGVRLKVQVDRDAEPGYREVRAVAPGGASNLLLVRLDRLEPAAEVEPNDEPRAATPIPRGSAGWGVLKAQDVDHFRLVGRKGERVTIDLEAQRLGTPVVPVLTLMTANGSALAQARETRGADHDARLDFTFPADGAYVVEVRDSLYAGGDSAVYRVRVEATPFATGLFPLGGRRGEEVRVIASGGSLEASITKLVRMPETPGQIVDPGPLLGPGVAVLSPMRLVVGDGPEILESTDQSPTEVSMGAVANGRLSTPGEVDRFTVVAKKGERLVLRIRASDLGSWIDSVLTVSDAKGQTLAENDDPIGDGPQRGVFALNRTVPTPDSQLVFEAKEDGPVTVEVADRYGDGGPAYAYRLEVGPARPDFTISLFFANPAANLQGGQRPARRANLPGSNGVLNLRAGQSVPLNFLITAEGNIGPVEVRAEGLPPGVTVAPKTIRAVPASGRAAQTRGRANADNLILKVAPDAAAGSGELKITAEAKPPGGPPLVREALAAIAIDTPLGGAAPPRPVMRTISRLPIRVLGRIDASANAEAKPPSSFELRGLVVPGVLLQGGRLDLEVRSSPSSLPLTAKATGRGLSAQAILAESAGAPGIVRVTASVDAPPGVGSVAVTATKADGTEAALSASVIVRAPIEVFARDEAIAVERGRGATLLVTARREVGFDGPIDLRLALPEGVRVRGQARIAASESVAEVNLEGDPKSPGPFSVKVEGVARMPRGPVRVESKVRPRLLAR